MSIPRIIIPDTSLSAEQIRNMSPEEVYAHFKPYMRETKSAFNMLDDEYAADPSEDTTESITQNLKVR